MWEMVSKWSLICFFLMSEICISWYLKIISSCMNHYFLAHFSVGFLVFFIQKRTLCLGYLLLCVACESVSSSVVSNSLPPHGLSMGLTRQEYWSGLPFPSSGDLPETGIKPGSPELQASSLPSELPGKPTLHDKKYMLLLLLSHFSHVQFCATP